MAALRRDRQWRPSVFVRLVHGRARAEQRHDRLRVAALRRDEQRRRPVVVRLAHGRARAEQRRDRLRVAALRRDGQRRRSVDIRLVHRRARAEKPLHERVAPQSKPDRRLHRELLFHRSTYRRTLVLADCFHGAIAFGNCLVLRQFAER